MKRYFLADAHLKDPRDLNYRHLLGFLRSLEEEPCELFLLGDIFEFWMGYRHTLFAVYVPLLEQLRRLREQGTEIVFVEGNHDFRMGPYFTKTLGCTVFPREGLLERDGRRIHISHGDLVDEEDFPYRLLRAFLRCAPFYAAFSVFPPDWAWEIARWAGRRSRKKRAAREKRWDPENLLRRHARRRFAQGADLVITGHFHFPWLEESEEETILALGDWISQFSYAILDEGKITLTSYPTEEENRPLSNSY
ncbi:MAG: UDP-2,3-diacylglucosamine diphosphatase [Desulfuromonadaceae bacterium]|nr:UDP-2,3-diacylglucosamine diphosphatase [Desulfuromonadaceae bacterium]